MTIECLLPSRFTTQRRNMPMTMHHKLLVLCSGHFLTAPYPPALVASGHTAQLRSFVARHLTERDEDTSPDDIVDLIDCAAHATFAFMSSQL